MIKLIDTYNVILAKDISKLQGNEIERKLTDILTFKKKLPSAKANKE